VVNISRVVATVLFVAAGCAHAQSYPTKPIRLVIPYTSSGSGDVVARTIGAKLTEAWGQQILIDNRPGGNGNVGTEMVARAPANGYTLLLGSDIQFGINPHLFRKLPYDSDKDFAAVVPATFNEFVLFVHPSVPASNLRELIFREDNVVFSLAHRLISTAEFDQMQAREAVAGK